MKRTIQKLLIIFFFLSCGLINWINCNPFAEQISSGNVSKDIEYEIKEILCDIKVPEIKDRLIKLNNDSKKLVLDFLSISNKLPEIRKTSQALAEHNSNFLIGGFYKEYNYLYINEDLFKQLNNKEKIYWIQDSLDYLVEENKLESLIGSHFGPSIFFGLLSFIYLQMAGLDHIHFKIFGVTASLCGGVSLVLYLSAKNAIKKYNKESKRYYIDKAIVNKYNCIDDAITFLEKVVNSSNILSLSDEQIKDFNDRLVNLKKNKM